MARLPLGGASRRDTRGGGREARACGAGSGAASSGPGTSAAAPAPGRAPMGSPPATPQLLYRSTRLLRMTFQHLHHQQQRADVFCDVVLQAEGETVAAHCCVLSVCSPFFMERLSQELPPRGRRVVLELGGLKIGVLRKLVRFLYTAELEATREEVQEVLAAARHLRVTELESLQLLGGRLVRLGPPRQLNRSCLGLPQHSSPIADESSNESSSAGNPRGSTSVPPQGQPGSPGTKHPSPVGRVKLRKVESGGCWEVVRDTQPPTVPSAVAAAGGGVTGPRCPPDVGALRRAGKHSLPQWNTRAAWRKQGRVSPTTQHGCGQGLPLGSPPNDPEEEEEVDVGMVEPCLPPSTTCAWPWPSSESDEEVDILT